MKYPRRTIPRLKPAQVSADGAVEYPTTLLLVRHAKAGKSADWTGSEDYYRRITEEGMKQARRLVGLARTYAPIVKIVSSPYVRAVQTITPLAEAVGMEPELIDALGDDNENQEGAAYIRALVHAARARGGGTVVVCGHGGLAQALGFGQRFRKGAVWVFEKALRQPTRQLVL